MDKSFLVQLTNNLYRLTLLFPKKEPLRYKMRELADNILADSILILGGTFHKSKNLLKEIEKNIDILDGFFEIAKSQNWVGQDDILAVRREYDNLKRELEEKKLLTEKSTSASFIPEQDPAGKEKKPVEKKNQSLPKSNSLSIRQEKILTILRDRGKAQVWQIKQVFPDISKRTLRRDFESLLNQGLINRIGERNDTFYQLKTDTV